MNRTGMTESETDSLLELAHGYIERSLNPAQIAELEAILSDHPEARRIYLDYLHDHGTLHWDHVAGGDAETEIPDFPAHAYVM